MQEIDSRTRCWRAASSAARTCRGRRSFSTSTKTARSARCRSTDVNAYIREVAGQDFTAKDFRTWAGTVLAACALCADIELASATARKRFVSEAIGEVAGRLGNTKAVCRKCYVHPTVIDAFLEGQTIAPFVRTTSTTRGGRHQLSAEEAAVVKLLTARLEARTRRRAA